MKMPFAIVFALVCAGLWFMLVARDFDRPPASPPSQRPAADEQGRDARAELPAPRAVAPRSSFAAP